MVKYIFVYVSNFSELIFFVMRFITNEYDLYIKNVGRTLVYLK
jgi:hypothetical protein